MGNKTFNQLIRKLTKNSKQGTLTYWELEEKEEFFHSLNKYGSGSVLGTGEIAVDKVDKIPTPLRFAL